MRQFSDEECKKIKLIIEKYGAQISVSLHKNWGNLPLEDREEVLNDFFLWIGYTTSAGFQLDDLLEHNRFGRLYKYANFKFVTAYNKYKATKEKNVSYKEYIRLDNKWQDNLEEAFEVRDIDKIWAFAATNFTNIEFDLLQRAYDLGQQHSEIADETGMSISHVGTKLGRLRAAIKEGLNPDK
jgi:hypothetical protein